MYSWYCLNIPTRFPALKWSPETIIKNGADSKSLTSRVKSLYLSYMFKIFIRHKLEDYAKWRPLFDEHSVLRGKYGCTASAVFTHVDNPNEVLVETVWENKEGAMQFLQDPGLKATMEKAGVIGAPEFSFSV